MVKCNLQMTLKQNIQCIASKQIKTNTKPKLRKVHDNEHMIQIFIH